MARFNLSPADSTPLAAPPAPGRARGFQVPRKTYGLFFAPPTDPFDVVFLRAGDSGGTGGVGQRFNADIGVDTVGTDWFEKVHSLPRAPVAFGSVISTTLLPFQVHWAGRSSTQLQSFTNNAGQGVSVPQLGAVPRTVDAHTTLLDLTASTRLNPVALQVQVTPEGPATINGTLVFGFMPGNDGSVLITGSRIAAIVFEPEHPYREILEFGVKVLGKINGLEQRISNREQPRQLIRHRYRLEGTDRRFLESVLFGFQGLEVVLPVWEERVSITTAITGGAVSTVDVTDTAALDFRVGGQAVLRKDLRTQETLVITAVATNLITLASTIQNSYAIGDEVMPMRTAHVEGDVSGARYTNTVQDYQILYRVLDNTTGSLTGSTAAFGSLNGKPFLDDCNIVDGGTKRTDFNIRVATIDNEIGMPFRDPVWDVNKRVSNKVFFFDTRQQLQDIRRLLIALQGPQKSFYLPSKHEDLLITQDITSASTDMVIENIGYTRFVQSRHRMKRIRATFKDTSSVTRVIVSSVETSTTEETLTIDLAWGVNKTVAEIQRVEFLELVRIAEDSVQIDHDHHGQGKVRMPVVTVFDEN